MLAAQTTSAKAPLPVPKFYWGIGIENCWIPQTNPAKDGDRRLLDVYLQMQHYDRWKEDLDLAAQAGVNTIRYSVPWYKAEPKPGTYDWSWIDKPIDYLVHKLKIIPIMDIIHYGTPKWMEDGVADPRFADSIAAYAGAMAAHFKGVVNHYSPHNEPGVTSRFCGLEGRWPPYQKSAQTWAKIGVQVAKGMVLEAQAIRAAISDAVLISVDPWFDESVAGILPKPVNPELQMAAASFPASLAYGKVTPGHPFGEFLRQQGVTAQQIDWFQHHSGKPDILGYNSYPDYSYKQDGDFTQRGRVPISQAAHDSTIAIRKGLRRTHSYFNLPVYLTETSAGLRTEGKVAYMKALFEMKRELIKEGFPLRGINW